MHIPLVDATQKSENNDAAVQRSSLSKNSIFKMQRET